jgi:trehalose/maltose transport system substrate-binding protein
VTRTWASLLAAGALVCGCGGVRVAHATPPVTGTVRYCATEPHERAAATAFNRAHARQGLSVRLTVHARAKSLAAAVKRGECDVVELAAAEVASYAAAGALRDLTAHVRARRREFVPATLLSGHYAKRDWALPVWVEVGMLYSRYYPIPKTLQDLYRRGGVVYGDGLDSPVGFLETAYAAGGRVLSPDGRHSALDSAPNRAALALLRAAVAQRRVRSLTAPAALHSYVHGHARFMRNWSSYVGDDAFLDGQVHGQLTPLPPFAGGRPATLMVGMELAVTRTARDPRAALAFVDGRVSVAAARPGAHSGYLPPLRRSYSDDERLNILGGGWVMRALRHAATLPVTPHLAQIDDVLTLTVRAALTGRLSVERALRQGSRAIDAVLANAAPGDES